ncbi:MAG: hypothetical protein ASARMPREDX12_006213 [Alectoria sarmentosa]|nr:MAG: hypothetical protein ASARMPREDX12_006213 [Alectoria sarmentosa]
MLDKNDLSRSDYDRQMFDKLPRPRWLNAAAGPKVLDPDPTYIAPSLFSHGLQVNQSIHEVLPSQDFADRIMEHYWECVHPVACIVHRASFQERYDLFWYNASRRGKDTPESTQALVYAALFAGVVSMDAETVREELGGEREEWVKTLERATAISLGRAHVIRTEKPETIQAFVMYLIPMCRDIISRTLATLVASAIDLARGMGLNKDGTSYGYDAIVTQSPRPRIRKDDFTTQFPLNVEDFELEESDLSKEGSERWTGMTLCIARMECNEKIREIYAARQQTRQGDYSDSAYIKKMLEMIYEFRQYMEKKYYPMIDDEVSIQHYARLIIDLHCRRMHAMVLHEYHMSTPRGRMPRKMPYPSTPPSLLLTLTSLEQWTQTVIKSGLETMEIAKEIETSDFLRRYRWYAGALQQHCYATLMLIEVFAHSGMHYEMRAWESLDWVFQVPSCVPHNHKGRWVLEGAVGVMKEYLKARKLRCPTLMDERLETAPSCPRMSTLLKPRKIAARPTTAQSRGKGSSHFGQFQIKSQGTIFDNDAWTLPNTNTLDHKLSQIHETSNMKASLQDMAITSGAQPIFMDGVMYEDTERLYTGRKPTAKDLLTSAPLPGNLDRVSSEEDSYIYCPPDVSPDGPSETTSSWQSVVGPDLAINHSGYSTGDNVTRTSLYLDSRVAGDGRRDVGKNPLAGPFSFAQAHSMYYPPSWDGKTAPLQKPPYGPTGDNIWHNNSSHGHSRSHSHNNSQIIDEGLYMHFPDHSFASFPVDSSSFSPANLDSSSLSDPIQQ